MRVGGRHDKQEPLVCRRRLKDFLFKFARSLCVPLEAGRFFLSERFLFKCQLKDVMEFNRRQFPLRAAYAGTVHKYQGDTIDENGLLLIHASNCFAHGQLSVAFSRARRAAQVMVVADEESTYRRVVHGMAYREFLELAPRADEDGYDSERVDDGPGPIDELYDTREEWW